jgi:glutaredoxin
MGDDQATRDRKSWFGLALVVVVAWGLTQWWADRQQADVGRRVAQAAAPGDIEMLSSTTCAICVQARLWFRAHRVPFQECFIETDPACAARFEATRAPGTPVILVRGIPQLGFSPQRLAVSLAPP